MSAREFFLAVTDLGEPPLLLPGAALLLIYLWRRGERRTVRALMEALAASIALTVGAKLGLAALAILTNGWHLDAEAGLCHLAQGGLHWPHPRVIPHGHQTWLVL